MPPSSFTSIFDEALTKAMADFAASMDLVAEAYRKFALATVVIDDDGSGTTGTIMSIHDGVPTDEELVEVVKRVLPIGRQVTFWIKRYDDSMMQKYWVALTVLPFSGGPVKDIQDSLSYQDLQCWPAGTRSAFECLVTRMVNTEFGLGLNSYTLFAGDVRKALLADIAERFGNLPLTVYVGDVIITVGDGEGYFFGTNAPTRLNSQSYEELRDRILMKIFQDMEEVEDDD